jgi:uncharacterized protein (DUF1330 family)
MAKQGYWIAHFELTNPEAYKAYQEQVMILLGEYGARFLVRGGRSHTDEAHSASRTLVIEFADYKAALRCYLSPEFAKAEALRLGNAVGNVVVIEGYDGPQPSDQLANR